MLLDEGMNAKNVMDYYSIIHSVGIHK
jgi:hypothetical protein